MRESFENTIEIKDCSYEVFLSFLEFLYTENVIKLNTLEIEHINELYSVADMYIVDQLKQQCVKALIKQIKMKNICKMLSESYKWGIFEVKIKCVDFALKHFGSVIGIDEFTELPPPVLKEILKLASSLGVKVMNQAAEISENNEH